MKTASVKRATRSIEQLPINFLIKFIRSIQFEYCQMKAQKMGSKSDLGRDYYSSPG